MTRRPAGALPLLRALAIAVYHTRCGRRSQQRPGVTRGSPQSGGDKNGRETAYGDSRASGEAVGQVSCRVCTDNRQAG